MITIVDYGLGNIQAFLNLYKRLNIEATRARTAQELTGATKVILPGVGAFDHAMEQLQSSGMRETLDDLAMNRRVPVLGICVGMQMLARGSEEGQCVGLGWIDGYVKRLPSVDAAETLPLPHMGWNDVQPTMSNGLFSELERDARFYFLHSYYFECERADDVAAVSRYGGEFTCAVTSRNIHGVQFHPEKSHHFGTRLLKNFAAI
ncbi:MAG: imidazole glycerol phosphate synthase subunit HisH [Gemmatimonadaceae bacterium]